jgi:hypothetical protein
MSGGRLFHPQPEDAPCRGDRDQHNMDEFAFMLEALKISKGKVALVL